MTATSTATPHHASVDRPCFTCGATWPHAEVICRERTSQKTMTPILAKEGDLVRVEGRNGFWPVWSSLSNEGRVMIEDIPGAAIGPYVVLEVVPRASFALRSQEATCEPEWKKTVTRAIERVDDQVQAVETRTDNAPNTHTCDARFECKKCGRLPLGVKALDYDPNGLLAEIAAHVRGWNEDKVTARRALERIEAVLKDVRASDSVTTPKGGE